jgi:hypothetical protein
MSKLQAIALMSLAMIVLALMRFQLAARADNVAMIETSIAFDAGPL